MEQEKYVDMAFRMYNDALKLLDRGDIFDAAEKAWCAVESARKAFLVMIGIPEDKAGSVEFGVMFFVRLLRRLGRRDLIEEYYNFDYCLHVKGFYELQIPQDILEEKIHEVKGWIEDVFRLAEKIKNVDLGDAIRLMDESLKLKRKILQMSTEYHRILQRIDNSLSRALS